MLVSVLLVQYIRTHYGQLINTLLLHAIGNTLVLVAVLLLARPYLLRYLRQRSERSRQQREEEADRATGTGGELADEEDQPWYRRVLLALAGAVVGFLVGLTSVDSGTLIIVTLPFLYPRLGPKKLVGTDIFQAFLLLLAGMVGYLSAGAINWEIVGLLLIGSLPGVYLGSKLSKFIPDRLLNPLLAIVLAISGLKLI